MSTTYNNTTLFVADLHLQVKEKRSTELFLTFLKKAFDAEALYILGDFFVLWAGDDDNSLFVQQIKTALKELNLQGVAIYLMPGNRDFLIGEKFVKECGCKLLEDPTVINLYERKTLLTHGDGLTTKEPIYKLFRRITRNKMLWDLFFRLPLGLRKFLAWTIHTISCLRIRNFSKAQILLNTKEAVALELQKYDCDQIIHGHIHLPMIIETSGKKQRHIVLGDWQSEASVLVYKNDGTTYFDI